MDWKPERAIQAKVRDFQNKDKKAWLLKRANGGTLCVGLQTTTSSRLLGQQWALSPRDISCYLVPGFTPYAARLFTKTSSPRKFAECLYYNVGLPPIAIFCLVSSRSSVICNYTVVQSSTVHTVIQITFIHSFIQLYIHTLILSHINAYTTYTQYQFIHGCISHPSLVWSYPFVSVFKLSQVGQS